jgi:hypothetical protein
MIEVINIVLPNFKGIIQFSIKSEGLIPIAIFRYKKIDVVKMINEILSKEILK